MVLIFSNATFRSDDKASSGWFLFFDGSIICAGVGRDGCISSKEAETKAIPVALNRAKVLGIKRNQVLCNVMEVIQAINGSEDWTLT